MKAIDEIDTIWGKIVITDAFGRKHGFTEEEKKMLRALEMIAQTPKDTE